ncbi:MAG: PaaI family thioesterase [Acidimicrobiales bacterium]
MRDDPDIGTPFQKWLGIRWETLDDGSDGVSVEMNMRDDLRGPVGSLEGGIVSTLADVAGASAIARTVGMVATQHVALSFLAPGRVGPIRATAVPLRIGRQDGVAEVRVCDLGNDGRLMAVALVTVRVLHDRDDAAARDSSPASGSDPRAS